MNKTVWTMMATLERHARRPRSTAMPTAFDRSFGAEERNWTRLGVVSCRLSGEATIGVLERPTPPHPFDEMQSRCRRLEAAYRDRGVAMAAAGHDLRQPLQVIGLVLSRLEAREADGAERVWLQAAAGEMARLASGLDQLAILAQDDDCASGGPSLGPISLNDVLSQTLATWRPAATARGLTLRGVETGLVVDSNARLLSVILGNLISNAIKYTDIGGVLLGCRRRGRHVEILVTDTGRGFAVPPQEAFGAFVRAENDMAGLGLGLSIVDRAARLLDHPVRVRSRPGGGSIISVGMERL